MDFFWNFRIVDSLDVLSFADGFVNDINSDNGHLYFKKVTFETQPEILAELKNKNSTKYK